MKLLSLTTSVSDIAPCSVVLNALFRKASFSHARRVLFSHVMSPALSLYFFASRLNRDSRKSSSPSLSSTHHSTGSFFFPLVSFCG